MDAIIYTTNTGFTAEYAKILGEKTGLPVYSLNEAKGKVRPNAEIIYLGWLMASNVRGYKKAAKTYQVRALCGVGMGANGSQDAEIRKANAVPNEIAVFTLQGGFAFEKLHGIYKFMMRFVVKASSKGLMEKADKTPEEIDMLDLIQNGGSRVSEENLSAVLDWYHTVALSES